MKKRLLQPTVAIVLLSGALVIAMPAQTANKSSASSEASAFLGAWDLTLKTPQKDYASWLEIEERDGKLTAQMVGRWGNARPLPSVSISGNTITFVSPKQEEGGANDMVFKGELVGTELSGETNGPNGGLWHWIGYRAPSLRRSGKPRWGNPIQLFDGKDLSGWKFSSDNGKPWTVKNGALASPGKGVELISRAEFEDFKLHIEFNCGPNSNSGVYLRGRYEVQIETDSAQEPPSHHTGGIYGFIAPDPELTRQSGVWQSFDITLIGRTVTVVQNGKTIIDSKEIPGITGGALDSHEDLPGPIYLQGSEDGQVLFRNIVVTPAK